MQIAAIVSKKSFVTFDKRHHVGTIGLQWLYLVVRDDVRIITVSSAIIMAGRRQLEREIHFSRSLT